MAKRRHLDLLRHRLAAAASRTGPDKPKDKSVAAVLVPLFEREEQLHVLYTRRSDRLLSHQGQVAFPGGKVDLADADLVATALREAHEEIGLHPHTVEIIGSLTTMDTMASGYSVAPFVGVIPESVKLRPNPREVAEIFSVPLADVTSEQRRYIKAVNFGLIYGMSAFGLAAQLSIPRGAGRRPARWRALWNAA